MQGPKRDELKSWVARHRVRISVTALVGVVFVIFGALGTLAAVTTPSASSSTRIAGGTVSLSDNDFGSALYDVSGQKPGDVIERCMTVNYDGRLPARVRLYSSSILKFGEEVSLDVRPGTDPDDGHGCRGFKPEQGRPLYKGTLKDFADSHRGFMSGIADTPGTARRWRGGDTVAYRFRMRIRDDIPTNGALHAMTTGEHEFTFEARSDPDALVRGRGFGAMKR